MTQWKKLDISKLANSKYRYIDVWKFREMGKGIMEKWKIGRTAKCEIKKNGKMRNLGGWENGETGKLENKKWGNGKMGHWKNGKVIKHPK